MVEIPRPVGIERHFHLIIRTKQNISPLPKWDRLVQLHVLSIIWEG